MVMNQIDVLLDETAVKTKAATLHGHALIIKEGAGGVAWSTLAFELRDCYDCDKLAEEIQNLRDRYGGWG